MRQTLLLSISSALILIFLIGCGSEKKSKDSSSARGDSTVVSYPRTTHLAECNRIGTNSISLGGQLGTFYDPVSRRIVPDYINLNISSAPSALLSGTYRLQFFRWVVNSTGTRQLNQIPVRLFYLDKLTGTSTSNQMVDTVSKTTMDQARQFFGSSWLNVSTNDFFARTMIVLTGIEMQYEGLAIGVYNSSANSSAVTQIDTLLPPFDSNPVNYKAVRPYVEIYSLHPNYSYLNSNATDTDYRRFIDDICRELSGVGSRIPASEAAADNTSFLSNLWVKIKSLFAIFF